MLQDVLLNCEIPRRQDHDRDRTPRRKLPVPLGIPTAGGSPLPIMDFGPSRLQEGP